MSTLVLLDAGPLGLVTNPRATTNVGHLQRFTPADLMQQRELPPHT